LPASVYSLVLLPVGLGLIGFVEPCSMGANLLFIKLLEQRSAAQKALATGIFTVMRGTVIGVFGVVAALLGEAFAGLQQGFWVVLGAVYLALGLIYLTGGSASLTRRIGPSLKRLTPGAGSAGLGLLFGLNIPACAAPLLFALFGAAAGTATMVTGFVTLAMFGIALSLPLVIAVSFPSVGRRLDRLAGLSRRMPFWTGVVFVVLGLWSIWFGVFVDLGDWI
jgi:cytochrome c-type biogenesis protein